MYPDPTIPAIVPEELWNRANALYKKRREEMMEHTSGESFQNRYPYSTKIICEEHGTTFHRQVLESKKGKKEVWQCKVYRTHGRAACSAPQIRSSELDLILSRIFKELMKEKQAIIDSLVTVLTNVPKEVDYGSRRRRVEDEIGEINLKKDRLLDLSVEGALTVEEFKQRNDALNVQIRMLEIQLDTIREQEAKSKDGNLNIAEIRRVLDRELSFEEGVNTAMVASILEKTVVKKESGKEEIHLDIYLKSGRQYEAVYAPNKTSASIIRLKSITPRLPIRKT